MVIAEASRQEPPASTAPSEGNHYLTLKRPAIVIQYSSFCQQVWATSDGPLTWQDTQHNVRGRPISDPGPRPRAQQNLQRLSERASLCSRAAA
jgi:hypothetical protein